MQDIRDCTDVSDAVYKGVERMRKVKGLGTLLLAGALFIGCGGSDTDKSPSKSEESNQTAEVTEVPTKEPTGATNRGTGKRNGRGGNG